MKSILILSLFTLITTFSNFANAQKTYKIIDGYFIGAWFKIKVPTNFSVNPSLKSASSNTPEAFDSVLFVSPEKDVEFYVYFPKLMGRPTDFEFSKNNENMPSESKTGDSKKTFEYSTYTAKDKSYTKSLVVITSNNTTNYAFGFKYKNQIAYDRYKTEYLEFKKSLVENRDDSKKESTSNSTQKEQKQKPTQQTGGSDLKKGEWNNGVFAGSTPQDLSPSQLKQLRNNLSNCSGNYLLTISAIKSQILTLGSDINNDKAIKINGAMNMFYSEIGKSIKGDDYDRFVKEYFELKINNYNDQKKTLGVSQAKQNIINDMMAKSVSCADLLLDSKNASYADSVIGKEKAKILHDYIIQNSLK